MQIGARLLDMARNYFPQTSEVLIDGEATIKAMKSKLRDKTVKLRDPNQVAAAVQQFCAAARRRWWGRRRWAGPAGARHDERGSGAGLGARAVG